MTEAEWLVCTDPETLFFHAIHRMNNCRRNRLFACACVRRIWPLLTERRSRRAVEVAECYADDLVDVEELEEAFEAAAKEGTGTNNATEAAAYAATWDDAQAADYAADCAARAVAEANTFPVASAVRPGASGETERAAQCDLIRCIFGNPFRPVAIDPSVLVWNDGTVRRIAQAIYDERAFHRLPILADALLDAGCDDEELMAHCRSAGPHVRGCWAVDLILGKG